MGRIGSGEVKIAMRCRHTNWDIGAAHENGGDRSRSRSRTAMATGGGTGGRGDGGTEEDRDRGTCVRVPSVTACGTPCHTCHKHNDRNIHDHHA